MSADEVTAAKLERLKGIISDLAHVAVALSGGIDSSYLLSICVDMLGQEGVEAITVDSPLLPRDEMQISREVAQLLGVAQRIIPLDELQIEEVVANGPRRCYYCKRARFEMLARLVEELCETHLLHGENADDRLDYRPGAVAAQELGVRAPLAEAGLTKSEIRALARQRGLLNWDRPAAACLASRFPYGTPLTLEGLERVEQAEAAVRRIANLDQIRVRDHFPVARIEVPPQEIPRLAEPSLRESIARALHQLSYRYVTLDLDGYRMGSLNEEIEPKAGVSE